MLDAGCGLPLDEEVRDAVLSAAKLFEAAGAIVIPVEPVLTREMLDGLDDFWRAKFWGDMAALSADRRAAILPYIHEWAQKGRIFPARAPFSVSTRPWKCVRLAGG